MNNFTALLKQMNKTQEYIDKGSSLASDSNKKANKILAEICERITGETNSANNFDMYGEPLQYQIYNSPEEEELAGIY